MHARNADEHGIEPITEKIALLHILNGRANLELMPRYK
jgi:hypothetical protein